MIIHTIISPEHIFYKKDEKAQYSAKFSTDPYFHLKTDMFYRKAVMWK